MTDPHSTKIPEEQDAYHQIHEPLLSVTTPPRKRPGACGKGFAWCIRSKKPDLHPKKAGIMLLIYSMLLAGITIWLLLENNGIY